MRHRSWVAPGSTLPLRPANDRPQRTSQQRAAQGSGREVPGGGGGGLHSRRFAGPASCRAGEEPRQTACAAHGVWRSGECRCTRVRQAWVGRQRHSMAAHVKCRLSNSGIGPGLGLQQLGHQQVLQNESMLAHWANNCSGGGGRGRPVSVHSHRSWTSGGEMGRTLCKTASWVRLHEFGRKGSGNRIGVVKRAKRVGVR